MKGKFIIGVDLGGTKILAGLVDPCGKVRARHQIPTELAKGAKVVLENIDKCVAAVWRFGVTGIGVGTRGNIDTKRGMICNDHFFPKGMRNFRLADHLSKNFSVPCRLDNDVRCFTLGEALHGAARGKSNVIGLTFGTGIGGGIIMNGKLLHGCHHAAGEFGHMLVSLGRGVKCGCGQVDHWEGLASGSAMANAYFKATGRHAIPSDFAKLARRGDKAAARILDESAEVIGAGLASLVTTLDPEMIVIGGGVARDPALWKPVLRVFKKRVKFPALAETPIVLSKLGGDANLIGAAALLHHLPSDGQY